MLRPNPVKARLRAGESVYGLFCALPSPALVEMIGCAGYGLVIIDTEHTLVSPQELENLIRAAEAVSITPLVRVPEHDPGAILRALDAGAMGVVVPHVRSRSDVDAAIRAAKYAPEGMRSLNSGRGPGYGWIDLTGYVARANAHAACDRAGVPYCAIPRTSEAHATWWERGVRAYVLGEERGLAARALGAHLAAHTHQEEA